MAERHDALELDVADPLAGLRARFRVPDGLIYLDGRFWAFRDPFVRKTIAPFLLPEDHRVGA